MVPVAGVEPARGISPMDFESTSSTSSNTPAGETSAYQRTAQAIIQDEPEKGNRKTEFLWREIG